MRTLATIFLAPLALAGCVVAPLGPAPGLDYAPAPAGVVYVAPAYPVPAPGYGWRYNTARGWGWYHPRAGWHRGWR